jgi:MYXO-CTERM domain-containing protein
MHWREEPVDESAAEELKELFTGDDHEDADACEGPGFPQEGCSCSSTGSGSGAAAGLFVLGIALARRRRRSKA